LEKGGEGKSTLSYPHNHVDANPMGPAFTVSPVDRLRRMPRAEDAVAMSGRVAGSNGAI